jgi:hypothetical protein
MNKLKTVLRMSLASVVLLTAIVPAAWAAGVAVPEIDAGVAGSAVALLIGGYLVAVSRWRRK